MDSETFSVRTGSSDVVLDLTDRAAAWVRGRGDGLLHVFVPHATAGLAVLATEYVWAQRLLRIAKEKASQAKDAILRKRDEPNEEEGPAS